MSNICKTINLQVIVAKYFNTSKYCVGSTEGRQDQRQTGTD